MINACDAVWTVCVCMHVFGVIALSMRSTVKFDLFEANRKAISSNLCKILAADFVNEF